MEQTGMRQNSNRAEQGSVPVLGITGGVGAGKSEVLRYLERRYQALVIQADETGKRLQAPGQPCYKQIAELFGEAVLLPGLPGERPLNREKLARLVFADPEKLRQLNALMHPAVKQAILEQIAMEKKAGSRPFLVVEAALLLEDHYDAFCDEVWYIDAGQETRIRRLMQSRGYDREKALQIMANQRSEAEYRAACKFVIDNNGDFVENTCKQLDKGLREHGFLQFCQRQQRQ